MTAFHGDKNDSLVNSVSLDRQWLCLKYSIVSPISTSVVPILVITSAKKKSL
eukprot:CAMPEP_0170508170 /NCGR_PEP_ID=MMETSP0208-20121228/61525_1 /TAXON_ID=197538 /ORGANISM="Strombidium inclinatum, Strain S3" /LENGTH=51 /DNA_ID=CAMNT_0010790925 /DNA_START=51 /DNA_END=203 /DNA_ORIENTATION=+